MSESLDFPPALALDDEALYIELNNIPQRETEKKILSAIKEKLIQKNELSSRQAITYDLLKEFPGHTPDIYNNVVLYLEHLGYEVSPLFGMDVFEPELTTRIVLQISWWP